MRRTLATGILAMVVLGVAGLPTCDSGGVARAEGARPVPYLHPNWFMRELEVLSEENQRRYGLPALASQPGYESQSPPSRYQRRQGAPVGDFWRPDEIDRIFGRPPRFRPVGP